MDKVTRSDYNDFSKSLIQERDQIHFDHPLSLDFDLLIKLLKVNKYIESLEYDYIQHLRTNGNKKIYPQNIILLEGILTFAYKDLSDLLDIQTSELQIT